MTTEVAPAPVRRSRTVLYVAGGAIVVVAVLLAVLASAKPNSTAGSPLIGKPAPPISGALLNGGGTGSLAQYRGEWVLVNFAASWCLPCRQETPQLQAFQAQHAADHSATILAVGYDPTDTSGLSAFLRQNGATWPALADSRADLAYGVTGLPESYLVDPSGKVEVKYFGPVTAAQLDSAITAHSSGS